MFGHCNYDRINKSIESLPVILSIVNLNQRTESVIEVCIFSSWGGCGGGLNIVHCADGIPKGGHSIQPTSECDSRGLIPVRVRFLKEPLYYLQPHVKLGWSSKERG